MLTIASVIRARSPSKLAGRNETKRCLKRIPTQKSPGVLNQEIAVAKLSFHHVQSVMTGRISKQLCGEWNAIWLFE